MRLDHHCTLCGQPLRTDKVSVPPIAEAIRLTRSEAGLNQTALAKLAGVSKSYLCDLEQGKRNPSYGTMAKIAAACGIKTSELCMAAEGVEHA